MAMTQITVIQTADLHGRLNMQTADYLRQLKSEHDALLFDCGDALPHPNYLHMPGCRRAIEAMNAAGYDAMAMGNREFGWRSSTTAAKLTGLQFPVLSANLTARTNLPAPVKPWLLLQHGERVAGVFGISPDMAPVGSLMGRTSDLGFTDPICAAKQTLECLREQCDLTIGLLHWGTAEEQENRLIPALQGLNLALMGHWHVRQGELSHVGAVTVSRVAYHGRQAAILRLQSDGRWHQELVDLP